MNLFEYVGNGPTGATDPSGMLPTRKNGTYVDDMYFTVYQAENLGNTKTPGPEAGLEVKGKVSINPVLDVSVSYNFKVPSELPPHSGLIVQIKVPVIYQAYVKVWGLGFTQSVSYWSVPIGIGNPVVQYSTYKISTPASGGGRYRPYAPQSQPPIPKVNRRPLRANPRHRSTSRNLRSTSRNLRSTSRRPHPFHDDFILFASP